MTGIKNLLFGIALLIAGNYHPYLALFCLPLGAIYCIYGLVKKGD